MIMYFFTSHQTTLTVGFLQTSETLKHPKFVNLAKYEHVNGVFRFIKMTVLSRFVKYRTVGFELKIGTL